MPSFFHLSPGAVAFVGAGCVGVLLGLANSSWQWAVEVAQTQSGSVPYESDDIPGLIHRGLWSLAAQLSALALAAGVSEYSLSVLLSGLMGMLAMQALTMWVFAPSERAVFSIVVPLVALSAGAMYGVNYPPTLLGAGNTFGILGMSYGLLGVGLLAANWQRSAVLILTTAPAVQAPVGGFLLGVAIVCLLSQPGYLDRRRVLPYVVSGLGICCGSLVAYLLLLPDIPSAGVAETQYLTAFIERWDEHRRPIDWGADAVLVTVYGIGMAVWILRSGAGLASSGALLLVKIFALSGLLSLLFAALTKLPIDAVPESLLSFIPGRFVNITGITFVAVTLGLISASSHRFATLVWPLLLSLAFFRGGSVMNVIGDGWPVIESGLRHRIFFAIAFVVVLVTHSRPFRRSRTRWNPSPALRHSIAAMAVAASVALAISAPAVQSSGLVSSPADQKVLDAVAAKPGKIATAADLGHIQLRTRRPLLLDGSTLDTLPYNLFLAPRINAILQDVYGMDLLAPPADAVGDGRIPRESNRATWESFTLDRWRDVGVRWKVTSVLTYADWRLQLSSTAVGDTLRLHDISFD